MRILKNKVLAEILAPEEKTSSGIILMNSEEKKYHAKVLAVGPKAEYVKVGDTIKYYQGSGTPYTHEGKKCLFFKEDVDIDHVV